MPKLSSRAKRNILVVLLASVATIVAMAINPWGYFDLADSNGAIAAPVAGNAKRACNPDPPDYPGCTIAQINSWEDGDFNAAKAHYKQNRWGRAGFSWSHLGDAHDAKLRHLYNDAVARYEAKMRAHGIVGKAAQPRFATWTGFKAAADCSGGGAFAAIWGLMCRFNDAIDSAVPTFSEITLVCGGWTALASGIGGGYAALFTTVAPGAVAATALTTQTLCTLHKIAGNLGIPQA